MNCRCKCHFFELDCEGGTSQSICLSQASENDTT